MDFVNRGHIEYSGGCHCGAVRFRFMAGEVLDVLRCNCSICARTGYLHVTVPHAAFELLSDHSTLAEYRFGTRRAAHWFCRVCGIKSFYQPRSHPDCFSIHLGCVDSDPSARIVDFDGRHWEQSSAALGGAVFDAAFE